MLRQHCARVQLYEGAVALSLTAAIILELTFIGDGMNANTRKLLMQWQDDQAFAHRMCIYSIYEGDLNAAIYWQEVRSIAHLFFISHSEKA